MLMLISPANADNESKGRETKTARFCMSLGSIIQYITPQGHIGLEVDLIKAVWKGPHSFHIIYGESRMQGNKYSPVQKPWELK